MDAPWKCFRRLPSSVDCRRRAFTIKAMRINNANMKWSLCCLLFEPLLCAPQQEEAPLNLLCFRRVISLALTMMLQIIARVYSELWIMILSSHSALIGGVFRRSVAFSTDIKFHSPTLFSFSLSGSSRCSVTNFKDKKQEKEKVFNYLQITFDVFFFFAFVALVVVH